MIDYIKKFDYKPKRSMFQHVCIYYIVARCKKDCDMAEIGTFDLNLYNYSLASHN